MRRFPILRAATLAAVLSLFLTVAPMPAVALGAPETLAVRRVLGPVHGPAEPVETPFDVDYLSVSWIDGTLPEVRFGTGSSWSEWKRVELDDIPLTGGRTYAALLFGRGAEGYQIRGEAEGVEAMAINTTDGTRRLVWTRPEAQAHHLAQPPVITRAQWGADESLRFNGATEKGTRTFYPTQKLIVHHTVTANEDPDPAATIRAIYYDHVVNRGFLDIAYNFLLDPQGNLYKGRYSGPQNTMTQDTITGENALGHGVSGAHTGGYNSGTMGVAILGNYVSTPIPEAARRTLVQHLAWEAERHGLPPLATSTYTNPESGAKKTAPNISGHRDWTATQCPGEMLYQILPGIRQEAAALVGSIDNTPPRISGVETRKVRRRSALVRWRTSEPASGQIQYWLPGRKRRTTPLEETLQRGHKDRLAGLRPGSDYRFRVLGWDSVGNGSFSRPKLFTTTG